MLSIVHLDHTQLCTCSPHQEKHWTHYCCIFKCSGFAKLWTYIPFSVFEMMGDNEVMNRMHFTLCYVTAFTLLNNQVCWREISLFHRVFHSFCHFQLSVFLPPSCSWSGQILTLCWCCHWFTLLLRDVSRVPFTNSSESQGLFMCSFYLHCRAKCIPLDYHDFH